MSDAVCAGCGRNGHKLRKAEPGSSERFCWNCAAYRNQVRCSCCDRQRRSAGVNADGEPWCPTCRTAARRARLDDEARARIVEAVCVADPTAEAAIVAAVLGSFAAHTRSLRRVDRHLADHPEVFTDGPTHAHYTVGRFVEALIDAGVGLSVSFVDCARCGRNLRTMRTDREMRCASCANKARATACGRCGVVSLVATREDNGAAVCARCLAGRSGPPKLRGPRRHRQIAAEIVELVHDLDFGIDPSSVSEAIEVTTSDNQHRDQILTALKEGGALSEPGRRGSQMARFADELRERGADIAPAQRPAIKYRCPNCDRRTGQANATKCRACILEAVAASFSDCTQCGRRTRHAVAGLCGRCYRWARWVCDSCDATRDLVAHGDGRRCHQCLFAAELDTLAGADPQDWVIEICDALRRAKCVPSTRKWLTETTGGRLLGRLAAGEIETSHAELDRRSDRSIERLRGLLIVTGGLAPDNASLVRIETAVMEITTTIGDAGDRRIVQSYLRWAALPKIRRRAEQGASIVHSGSNLRQRTSVICRFIATLNSQNRTLLECRQVDIDNWFAAPGARPAIANSFITWARRNHHLGADLDIPKTTKNKPSTPIDHQLRWAHARRLVIDDTLSPDDRVAGALVALYAQPLTRIAALTVDDVVTNVSGEVSIDFGTHQIDLTEPFATLARQLPVRRQDGAADQLHTRWLFPATRPDRAVHPTTIATRLGRIGIDASTTRLAAVSQLASQIPPALLAESIGIGARQASKWVGVAGGNWTNYTGD